jgi:hypothetical protein
VATNEQGLIPIVIGIAGHRDVPADSQTQNALETAVLAVLDEFDQAYPNSPKVLLSPLAPGADQLAAAAALKRPSWSVRAPLPFEPSVYLESTSFQVEDENHNRIANQTGRQKFQDLLGNPRVEWFVVPLPPDKKPADGNWTRVAQGLPGESNETKDLRRACYANPGGYIVRHSQTLLALWDGNQESPNLSGTAEVVRFKLGGVPPTLYPRRADEPLGFESDRGPVIVLHTPRTGKQADSIPAGARSVRVPTLENDRPYGQEISIRRIARRKLRLTRFLERMKRALNIGRHQAEYDQFLSICQTIDDFNREARGIRADEVIFDKHFAERMEKVDQDQNEIFPPGDPSEGHCPALRSCYRHLLEVREVAGHLTGRLAPVHGQAGLALFFLLFLALLSFHFYAHPLGREHGAAAEHSAFFFVVFSGVWLILAGLVIWAWWIRLDDRRLDYRALAEALRVRRAWAQAGIGSSVSSSYLGQLRSEVVWVRRALQHLCPPSVFWERQFAGLDKQRQADRLTACARWVEEQQQQHEKGTKKEHTKAVWYRAGGFCFALAGLLVLASLWDDPIHPFPLVLVAGSLLIILGGLLIAICERRAHEELAKQYERMHMIFRSGLREMTAALREKDVGRAQTIITVLGREAIQENAQWLILRRSRPLELPLGA